MQMDEEVGKLASATPVMICMLLSYLLATYNLLVPPVFQAWTWEPLAEGVGMDSCERQLIDSKINRMFLTSTLS